METLPRTGVYCYERRLWIPQTKEKTLNN